MRPDPSTSNAVIFEKGALAGASTRRSATIASGALEAMVSDTGSASPSSPQAVRSATNGRYTARLRQRCNSEAPCHGRGGRSDH